MTLTCASSNLASQSCAKVFSCSGKITPEFIKKNGIKPGDIIAIPNTRDQEIEQLSKIDDGIKIPISRARDELYYELKDIWYGNAV